MKFYAPVKLSENIHVTPEGYLLCVGVAIARTGDMIYGPNETPLKVGADGKVIVSRDEADVFHEDTIASFEGKPLTIGHPNDFVDPSNWSLLSKGIIQNVRRGKDDQKDDLIADILITDLLAIGLVKNGLREVSCGYEAEYIQTEEGRGIQKSIIGNHLALVEQGRAGAEYAINDSKNGKGVPVMKKTFSEKLKAIFARVADEAEKMDDEAPAVAAEKKDDKKVDDAAAMYGDIMNMCKDLMGKIEAMAKPKDAEAPVVEKKAEEKQGDEESPAEKTMEDRLKAVEMALAKIMEKEAVEEQGDESAVEKEVESDDAAAEGEEKKDKSEDEEEVELTGDTASRAEILAPGIARTKDVKVKALKKAYETKDGKKIIEALNGGKAPAFDSAANVDMLFIAASEILRQSRDEDMAKTRRTVRDNETPGVMTAEKLNEIHAKHYGLKN